MKRIAHTVFFVVVFFQILSSQEFAPDGATWHFPIFYAFNSNTGALRIDAIKSVLNGEEYKVLVRDDKTCFFNDETYFIKERNDSIFMYDNLHNTLNLAIDFTADIGDSWTINRFYGLVPDTIECIVDSISFLNISSDDSLRVQHVHFEPNSTGRQHRIIESIGFDIGVIPIGDPYVCDGLFEGHIRCYEDDVLSLIQFDTVACDFTPVHDILSQTIVSISPNPAFSEVHIQCALPIQQIRILDLKGEEFFRTSKNNFSVASLPKGFYYFVILGDRLGRRVEKFIKI